VFAAPDESVRDFPYASTAGTVRWWAVFSDFVHHGPREGMSGIVFRLARTAGDNYRIVAYLDLDRSLDIEAPTSSNAFCTFDVGEFEVWRRVTLRAHWRKTASLLPKLPSIAGHFADAYVDVDDQTGSPHTFTRGTYDAAFLAAREAVKPDRVPSQKPVSYAGSLAPEITQPRCGRRIQGACCGFIAQRVRRSSVAN
jgi:hypothetical protein